MKEKLVDGKKECPVTVQTGCISYFRNQMLGGRKDSLKLPPFFRDSGLFNMLTLGKAGLVERVAALSGGCPLDP